MGIFLVNVLNSLSLNLSRRIFCIFYGSSHWSFSGALSPARTRLTSGLSSSSSSSVCADCHMFNGPPKDQRQDQAADRAGGVLLQRVPEAGQAGGGSPRPCSSVRCRWTFGFRADARSGTRTHSWTPAPPGPVCTGSNQASHRCLSPPPLDADRRGAPATFTFRSGQISPSCRLAALVWIVKSKWFHRALANEQTKLY